MSARSDYSALSADLVQKFLAFSLALKGSAIEEPLRHLVNIRASQMNGCAFCTDMHVKEARIAGERELRLHHIAIWRDSPLFDARERATLEWTEALTRLSGHGVADEIYDSVRRELSEKELSDLTFAIMAINGWNRVAVGFRTVPGSLDQMYGLAKAGLA